MNQIALSSAEILLGLLAATLVGVAAGYVLRVWIEQRGRRPETARGRGALRDAGSPGDAVSRRSTDRGLPGRGFGSAPSIDRAPAVRPRVATADPWHDETPVDVQGPLWPQEEGDAGKITVLVVDDRMELRAVHSTYLQQHGYRVITAADGEKALTLIRQHHPAVVVLDHSLPGRTGIEVTRELKSDPRTAGIPIILMTAHSYGAIGMAAKQAGVAAFLPKPVDPSRVLREVERHTRVDVHDA